MVVITQYACKTECEVELRYNYLKDWKSVAAELFQLGFKYNKLRRTFRKRYVDVSYTEERLDSDLLRVKELFGEYKTRIFKLVKEESNV